MNFSFVNESNQEKLEPTGSHCFLTPRADALPTPSSHVLQFPRIQATDSEELQRISWSSILGLLYGLRVDSVVSSTTTLIGRVGSQNSRLLRSSDTKLYVIALVLLLQRRPHSSSRDNKLFSCQAQKRSSSEPNAFWLAKFKAQQLLQSDLCDVNFTNL